MEELLIANPEIVFREDGDEALLFDPDTGEVKILNETGSFIYRLLDGKHGREEMIRLLMDRFEINDRKEAEKDLGDFLQQMRNARLLGEKR